MNCIEWLLAGRDPQQAPALSASEVQKMNERWRELMVVNQCPPT